MSNVDGIVNSARSLSYLLKLQQVAANNLANANTDGFKADRLTAHLAADGTYPVAVQHTDLEQGALHQTGRSLDFALEGPGFFTIATPEGERLTRGGSFRLDAAGRLVTADNDPVLNDQGQALILNGADIQVGTDGTVTVDGAPAGRLRVATVENPSAMLKAGGNLFIPGGPLHDVEGSVVRQGHLELANVDPVLSTVDLVTIQRAYTANLDALKAMDSVLATITSDIGKV